MSDNPLPSNLNQLSSLLTKPSSKHTEVHFNLSPQSQGFQDRQAETPPPQFYEEEEQGSQLEFFQQDSSLEQLYAQKMMSLKERNQCLVKDVADLNSIISNLRTQVNEVLDENNYLSSQLASSNSKEISLLEEISQLKIKVAKEAQSLKESVTQSLQSNQDILDLQNRFQTLSSDHSSFQEENKRLHQELSELTHKNSSLTSQNLELKATAQEFEDFRNETGLLKTEKDDLQEYITQMDSKNNQLLEDIGEISLQVDQGDKELSNLQSENLKLREKQAENQMISADLVAVQGQILSLENDLDDKRQELQQKNITIEKLEVEFSKMRQEVGQLLEMNATYESSLQMSRGDLMRAETDRIGTLENLRSRLQDLLKQREQAKGTEMELKTKFEQTQLEMASARGRESELKEQVDRLHSQLVESEAKREHVEGLFNELSKEITHFEEDVHHLRQENGRVTLDYENLSKISKTYELLWVEVASKAKEAAHLMHPSAQQNFLESLEVPSISAERFNDEEKRNDFLSQLCSFEQGLKDMVEIAIVESRQAQEADKDLQERDEAIGRLEEAVRRMKLQLQAVIEAGGAGGNLEGVESRVLFEGTNAVYGMGASMGAEPGYKEAYEQLKFTFNECMNIFERHYDQPAQLEELTGVIQEYCDARVRMAEVEQDLKDQENQVENTNLKQEEIEETQRVLGETKDVLDQLSSQIEVLDRRQRTLMSQLKKTLNFSGLVGPSPPKPIQEQRTVARPSGQSRSQQFFTVSGVDSKIARLLEEGSSRVKQSIRRTRQEMASRRQDRRGRLHHQFNSKGGVFNNNGYNDQKSIGRPPRRTAFPRIQHRIKQRDEPLTPQNSQTPLSSQVRVRSQRHLH